ncbi:c-type cytochrome [Zestomonas thermotolerans]|jgi:cytochrome c553|uniref:c-type cytochrome n=1 Tax=Zestomonas thermotolerans TaxID=157784 RepID=UPI0003A1EFD6|nr:c-type cytochrome [Pseudomonas thermotolerans]
MRTRTAPLPLLFLCISALVQANDDPMARFDAIMGNPEQRAQAYAAGQERITLCGYCHGEDGNSKRDYIPNLAGQNPRYLFSAFEQYVDGHRTHFVMNQAAKMLSLEERVNIAVYFSQQTVKARQSSAGEPSLQDAGQAVFQDKACYGCHGDKGQGQENAPRLAGQPAEYLRVTLNKYREGDPSRTGSIMQTVAPQLSEREIDAVAAYLQQLTP